MNILIVENDPNDAEVIHFHVRGLGKFFYAKNRSEFHQQLAKEKIDVILADYSLPDLTAVDVLRVVNTQYQHIPVIVVSGTITDSMGADLLKFHAADYVIKDRLARLAHSVQQAYETKRDQLRKLRNQRIENVGSMAMGIIHDLNNILSPVLTVLSMIGDDVPEQKKKWVVSAQGNILRGADMLKQILVFIRGMNGHFSQIDIKPMLRQALMFMNEVFPKNIHIVDQVKSNLPRVQANATQIYQVLINFCVNAQYAVMQTQKPYNEITIVVEEIELRNFQPFASDDIVSGHYLNLEVRDTGCGMPEHVMKEIFKPYFTTKDEEGTGLGLSTCLTIAKAHNGFIDVMSRVGIGSTFRFLIPTSIVEQEEDIVTQELNNPPGKGETILLAEDEHSFQEILKVMLESFNYKVFSAYNGAEALGIFYSPDIKIDLVLTDMMMPVMSGPQLVAKLREKDPAVKIIGMTGIGSRAEDTIVLQLNGAINKPCSTSQLLTVIRSVLDQKPEALAEPSI